MKRLQFLSRVKDWFIKLTFFKKLLLMIVIIAAGWFFYSKVTGSKRQPQQYQTSAVERGTIVSSVSASGTVLTNNLISVTTQASGIVKEVFVKEGDTISVGEKIAEIQLDQTGQQKNAAAWSSYLAAKNTPESAQAQAYTLQSDMFNKWDTFRELATNSTYQNADGTPNEINRSLPEFHIAQKDWLAAEAKYKNQQSVITQAQAALNNAKLLYEQSSATILAPVTGLIANLLIAPGLPLESKQSSSSSDQTAVNNKVAVIKGEGHPIVSLNVAEVDIAKVKSGQAATVTLDSQSDKTFTGKVLTVDKLGSVTSGVTNYPVTIQLDNDIPEILPNMAASAKITIDRKTDVLIVPSSAVQMQNGQSTARRLKGDKVESVLVETGLTSDTQTEVISGLSEGDTVITGSMSNGTNQRSGQTQSPFGGFGGMRMGR